MEIVLLTVAVPALAIGAFASYGALKAYRTYAEIRAVNCPSDGRTAVVQIDAGRAARAAVVGRIAPRVRSCSRWPEKRDCAQLCLSALCAPSRPITLPALAAPRVS